VGAVTPLDDRHKRSQKSADEAMVELLIERAQNGSEEGGKLVREALGHKRRGLRSAGRCGRIAGHTKPPE
jgi:hypothetical protein